MRNTILEGKYVRLEEVTPKHFENIIKWRNDPELNKFLNQPYKLTLELQEKWYSEKYLNDFTQGLFVIIDKSTNIPFGTLGWTEHDKNNKICVSGRVLVYGMEYRVKKEFLEATLLYNNYLYDTLGVETVYAHIVRENETSKSWSKNWGFKLNVNCIRYPHELLVNNMVQDEYIRRLEDYMSVREKITKLLKL